MDKIKPVHFILFWLILNLVQAWFGTLTSDEGYYWFYSTKLEWGYYDHPPFLALLIHWGYALIENEMGVRMLGILLNGFSLFLLFRMLPKEVPNSLIYLIFLSFPLLNYITFIVFPDTPLLAFSLWFLYGYKRLLEKNDWWSVGIIGLATALMMYSKYHAVLLVGFTVLSNLKLFRNPRFYLAMILAFILFFPHLYWQVANDFPSFKYHLSGRTAKLGMRYVPDYILQQIVAIGPGLIFIPFIIKTKNQFEYSLKFISIATLSFFLLMSVRGMIHFHWTSIIIFPVIILAGIYYSNTDKKRIFRRVVLPFLVLLFLLRLHLAFKIYPSNNFNVDYYHGRELWAADIARLAEGNLVLFENNLREAPLYTFYSGNTGLTLYPGPKKKSQYEIWNYEDSLQNQDVLMVKNKPFDQSKFLMTGMEKEIHYLQWPKFQSYQNIRIELDLEETKTLGDSLDLRLKVINHRAIPLSFESDQFGNPVRIYCATEWNRGKEESFLELSPEQSISANSEGFGNIKVSKRFLEEEATIFFGFMDKVFEPSINSPIYDTYQILSSSK